MIRTKLSLWSSVAILALALACGREGNAEQASSAGAKAHNEDYSWEPTYFPSYTSDPEVKAIGNELWVFTSHDIGVSVSPTASTAVGFNFYPMDRTRAFVLNHNLDPSLPSSWTEQGAPRADGVKALFGEEQYASWVNQLVLDDNGNKLDETHWGTNHMWAPGYMYDPDTKKHYLLVPDVIEDLSSTDPSPQIPRLYNSRIGVSEADSPAGPYVFKGTLDIYNQDLGHPYASDPAVAIGPDGTRYLLWANGDWNSKNASGSINTGCGGISVGKLVPDTTKAAGYRVDNAQQVKFDDPSHPLPPVPDSPAECKALNRGHPYTEGASIYYLGDTVGTGGDGPWYMLFSFQPGNGTQDVGYARAQDPLGTWKYEGRVLDSDDKQEGTNQASIAHYGGDWLVFYHDGKANDGNAHYRQVRAECFKFDQDGKIRGYDYSTGALLPEGDPTIDKEGEDHGNVPRTSAGLKCATHYNDAFSVWINTVGDPGSVTDGGSNTLTVQGGTATRSYTFFYEQRNTTVTLTGDCNGKQPLFWAGCASSSGNTCQYKVTDVGPDVNLYCPVVRSVAKNGTGTGTITSAYQGTDGKPLISCGSTCSASFPAMVDMVFTATPDAGSVFTSWSGCTSVTGNVCIVRGSSASGTATATFTKKASDPLTVTTKVVSNSGYYLDLQVGTSSTKPLTALTLVITAQNTSGFNSANPITTAPGGVTQQSCAVTSKTVTCTFTLKYGQTLPAGSVTYDLQAYGNGKTHATTGDTWSLKYTADGQSYTKSGGF